jgi:peptidoglycan hydrolase-like protein with peptidoglycan-binding domain
MDDEANTGIKPGEEGKGYKPTSKTLADFAKSGKKGLANDPDEVEVIKELQELLQDQGFDVSPDGKYGPKTIAAVKEFQTILGLKADGDAGPNTIKAILPFDNFIYGEEGGLKELITDLKRAEELVAKGKQGGASTAAAGEKPAGAPDSAMFKPVQNQSVDFRHLISIVEGKLNEALEQAEYDELQAIREKLKDGYEQLKAIGGVPKDFTNRITDAINDAGLEALKPTGAEADVDVGEPQAEPVGNAKAVADSIKGAVSGLGTDEATLVATIKSVKSKEEWAAVEKIYPNVWEDIRDDVDSYTGTWKLIVKHLASIGVVVPSGDKKAADAKTGTAANQGAAQPAGVAGAQGAGQPSGVGGTGSAAVQQAAQDAAAKLQGMITKATGQ